MIIMANCDLNRDCFEFVDTENG